MNYVLTLRADSGIYTDKGFVTEILFNSFEQSNIIDLSGKTIQSDKRLENTKCSDAKYSDQNSSHRQKLATDTQKNKFKKKLWQDTAKVLGTDTQSLSKHGWF